MNNIPQIYFESRRRRPRGPSVFLKSIIMASVCCCTSLFAANPVLGPYAGGMGTLSYVPKLTSVLNWPQSFTPPYGAITEKTLSLNYGLGGGGAFDLGFRFECFRVEAEIMYNRNNIKQVQFGSTVISSSDNMGLPYLSGQTTEMAGLANFFYDFYGEDDVEWVPYVGIGIGYANTRSSLRFFNAGGTYIIGTEDVNNSRTGMGQGIVGLSYYLDNVSDVFLDIRYLVKQQNHTLNDMSQRHLYTFNLGFNFVFDEMSLT